MDRKRTVWIVLTGTLAIAADHWLSARLHGWPFHAWVWAFNGVVLLGLGLYIRRLYRDKRYAERGLLRYAREAVCLYDVRGRFLDMNERYEELTGFGSSEREGVPYEAWFPEERRGRAKDAFALAVEGHPQHFDTRWTCRDGSAIEVEVSCVPVLSGVRIVGVYVMLKDVSEMKRNRELLQQSEKLAAIGELAAGIAHEIRNPLTSLKGFVQLTHGQAPTLYTEIMLSEIDRIHSITSELLLLGKPKTFNYERKPIVPLVDSILTLLHSQAMLLNVQIETVRTIAAEQAYIRCDETKMKQVFLNVLKNALEAMPKGGKVSVSIDREGDWAKLRIEDEGAGIPPEKLKKLGQAFFTTKETGTGLGLMISYSIIEQHGGRLSIESEESVGTTVHIWLPIEEERSDEPRAKEASDERG
ncbi:ATP-binding protein [Paenibacillus sp. TRM 82003]|nr:ATP-binding protein [Paenibacillus sp. TRM 82003]